MVRQTERVGSGAGKEGVMHGDVEFSVREAQPALIIRTVAAVTELPGIFGAAYGELFGYLAELGIEAAGMPYGAYHNMDMQRLDLEIGVPVSSAVPPRGRMSMGEIPAGEWATLIHTGPYDQMRPAYGALQAAISAAGKRIAGGAYEFYRTGPDEPPEKIETEIGFPLV
jgi:effector-binding domain-containing protein